jgi:hypothetical protein
MDLYVRLFSDENQEVQTIYLASAFLGHASAAELLEAFLGLVGGRVQKVLQISMDGPSVNFKMLDLFRKHTGVKVLELGSCGLHTVHNAFKCGFRGPKKEWAEPDYVDVGGFLSSAYWHFKDSPARRADFTFVTKSTMFPLKFCRTRWTENVLVGTRAIQIFDDLVKYVKAVQSKDLKRPENSCFGTLESLLGGSASRRDRLLAHLHLFVSLGNDMETFLKDFQSPEPMAPFLFGALQNLLKTLMGRFMKPKVLEEGKLVFHRLNPNDKEFHMEPQKVDIGLGAAMMRHCRLASHRRCSALQAKKMKGRLGEKEPEKEDGPRKRNRREKTCTGRGRKGYGREKAGTGIAGAKVEDVMIWAAWYMWVESLVGGFPV